MTVQELTTACNLTVFHLPHPERAVNGGYCGDLLSWVMGRAEADNAWLTIMSHLNVAAVASLTDVSCVILTEGVKPDAALLEKADLQELNLLGTSDTTFACAARLHTLLESRP